MSGSTASGTSTNPGWVGGAAAFPAVAAKESNRTPDKEQPGSSGTSWVSARMSSNDAIETQEKIKSNDNECQWRQAIMHSLNRARRLDGLAPHASPASLARPVLRSARRVRRRLATETAPGTVDGSRRGSSGGNGSVIVIAHIKSWIRRFLVASPADDQPTRRRRLTSKGPEKSKRPLQPLAAFGDAPPV